MKKIFILILCFSITSNIYSMEGTLLEIHSLCTLEYTQGESALLRDCLNKLFSFFRNKEQNSEMMDPESVDRENLNSELCDFEDLPNELIKMILIEYIKQIEFKVIILMPKAFDEDSTRVITEKVELLHKIIFLAEKLDTLCRTCNLFRDIIVSSFFLNEICDFINITTPCVLLYYLDEHDLIDKYLTIKEFYRIIHIGLNSLNWYYEHPNQEDGMRKGWMNLLRFFLNKQERFLESDYIIGLVNQAETILVDLQNRILENSGGYVEKVNYCTTFSRRTYMSGPENYWEGPSWQTIMYKYGFSSKRY